MLRRMLASFAVALLLAACTSDGAARPRGEPSGPPNVRPEVVADHAEQFATELPDRGAGSQEELAAATYVTGHLQQAGYVVLLDAVPVRNLVHSTNVVARPPSGAAPGIVVAVPYDTPASAPGNGEAIGVLLEVARALRVRVPGHSVQFVALGAEHAEVQGGRLGSRRLAQQLLEGDADPVVVVLEEALGEDDSFSARGPAGPRLTDLAAAAGAEVPPSPLKTSPEDEVWLRAGFDFAAVRGGSGIMGEVLLDYLAEAAR